MAEQIPATGAATPAEAAAAPAPPPSHLALSKDVKGRQRAKKRGPVQLIRVALVMLRGKSKKPIPVDVAEKAGALTKLVGSMRPLHLQDNPYPSGDVPVPVVPPPAPPVEQYEDVFPSPASPLAAVAPPSPSSSDGGASSRYASAQNLQELDDGAADEDGDYGGDCMIDAKAEEFIAKFYEQMKLQRSDTTYRYNRMIAAGKKH